MILQKVFRARSPNCLVLDQGESFSFESAFCPVYKRIVATQTINAGYLRPTCYTSKAIAKLHCITQWLGWSHGVDGNLDTSEDVENQTGSIPLANEAGIGHQ